MQGPWISSQLTGYNWIYSHHSTSDRTHLQNLPWTRPDRGGDPQTSCHAVHTAPQPQPLSPAHSAAAHLDCIGPCALPRVGPAPACPARLCLFCHGHVRVFRGTTEAIRSASRSGVRLTALHISFRARHRPPPPRLCTGPVLAGFVSETNRAASPLPHQGRRWVLNGIQGR